MTKLTRHAIATALGTDVKTINRWIREGLPGRRDKGQWRCEPAVACQWLVDHGYFAPKRSAEEPILWRSITVFSMDRYPQTLSETFQVGVP